MSMADRDDITHNTILTLADELGIKVVEQGITRDAEVSPIREVDGRMIDIDRRGPVTVRLQKAHFDLVAGKAADHADCLTQSSKS